MDPSENFDGGWEAGVDDGELLADVMLGPVHPYDRPDAYAPAHRWGSRHELVSEPFADPVDRVERDSSSAPLRRWVGSEPRQNGSGDGAVARKARGRPPAGATSGRKGATPAPSPAALSKKARHAELAADLGWTPADLKEFRIRLTAGLSSIKGMKGKGTRRSALAAAVGISEEELRRFQDAEARANGLAPRKEAVPAPPLGQREQPKARKDYSRHDLVQAAHRFGRQITSTGADALLYEAGWLLGIPRGEVTRILQRHDRRTQRSRWASQPSKSKQAAKRATSDGRARSLPPLQKSRPPQPETSRSYCPSCGAPVAADGHCHCS